MDATCGGLFLVKTAGHFIKVPPVDFLINRERNKIKNRKGDFGVVTRDFDQSGTREE
jgi:hypothetical protein